MSELTFKGGVHPYEGKELSCNCAIEAFESPNDYVFPVSQHIGAPARPIVEKGQRVLVGEKIAEASGFVSSHIHSSISGVVKAIEPRLVSSGAKVLSIVVENDGKYEKASPLQEERDVTKLSKEEIREAIQEAGVVGMGGACFPTHVKLSPKDPDAIDTIIVNGSECEPYLTSDYRRMLENPQRLIEGLRISLSLFKNAKGIIAIEDNKPEAIKLLTHLAKKEEKIEVKAVKTKYPQGGERTLIYALTGRQINSSMLPADVGCIVNNVDTVFAIYHAVVFQEPLISRIVTVTGDAIVSPKNFLVRIGANMQEVVDAAGGFKQTPAKILSGGPMMGMALYTLDIPIIKGSSAITCFSEDEVTEAKETNCINCGRCVSVCPGRILPARVADFAIQKNVEMFQKYHGMECCECGCCSYICPAKRNLTQSIKSMRKDILASRKK